MMPAPQIAIAWPTFSRGLMSSSTACDSGTSAAPKMPCNSRAATMPTSEVASPQSAEATVKPITEMMNTRLRPQCPQSQPVSGSAMAEATMYEVSTQVIWSCEACRLPCMCGSATLAMVVSSACMMVASMIEMVIIPRCGTLVPGATLMASWPPSRPGAR